MNAPLSSPRPPGVAYLFGPSRTGLWNVWKSAEPRMRLVYALFGGLGAVFWLGLFAGLWWLVGQFFAVEVFGPIIARKLLEMLLLSLFSLLLFSNVVTALSTYYLSDDLELLLALPIPRATFHYARLLETLARSGWMMLFFGLPVFLSYGIVHQADWVYYLVLPFVMLAMATIPAAAGVIVATFLVNLFSARRTRQAMVAAGGVALVGLVGLLRFLRPERLVDADDFENVAGYVASVQAPMPLLFPPRWAADVLQALLDGKDLPWVGVGLLATASVASAGASRWVCVRYYESGWARSQEAPVARLIGGRGLDRPIQAFARWFPDDVRPILIKDLKTFFRDPAQWSQLFLLLSLIAIYLFSIQAIPGSLPGGGSLRTAFQNMLAFLNLGFAGFVLGAIAVRFQFPAVSAEGRAFWILRSAPIHPERYLWVKGVPGLVPMIVVGQVLITASNILLGSAWQLTLIGALTAAGYAFALSGIALGMGAAFPDFKADNASRAATGPAGVMFMVVGLSLVGLVVALEALPVWYVLRGGWSSRQLSAGELALSVVLLTCAAALCAAATVLPVRRGARLLWSRAP